VLGPDPAKAEVFRRDLPPSRDFRELWSVLVALAAILFPLDVFVRRVAIDWGTLLRRMRGHAAAAPARKDERMDRLRTVKREAASRAPAFLEPPAKTGPSQPEAPREPGAPPPAAPADEPVAESYTGRLLAAKKRARERK